MSGLKSFLYFAIGSVVLGLCVMVWLLAARLEVTSTQLATTTAKLAGVLIGLEEVERNAEANAQRQEIVTDTRETIISMPVGQEEVAPVLLEGLRGADQIGGVQ